MVNVGNYPDSRRRHLRNPCIRDINVSPAAHLRLRLFANSIIFLPGEAARLQYRLTEGLRIGP